MSEADSTDLNARREQLRLRSAQLREQLSVGGRVMRPAFNATDQLRHGVSSLHDNRALVLLAGAALAGAALARPRTVLNLGLRAWSGWQLFRRVRPMVNSFLRQLM